MWHRWTEPRLLMSIALLANGALAQGQMQEPFVSSRSAEHFLACDGELHIEWFPALFEQFGFELVAAAQDEDQLLEEGHVDFVVSGGATLEFEVKAGAPLRVVEGVLPIRGAFLGNLAGRRVVLDQLAIEVASHGGLFVVARADGGPKIELFELDSLLLEGNAQRSELRLAAELVITGDWADAPGSASPRGATAGSLSFDGHLVPLGGAPSAPGCMVPSALAGGENVAASVGPDVVVADLQSVRRFATEGGISAYGVGTTACNLGTQRANWIAITNQHPVIVQNAYRLKDNRFEQIGLSWVKHGFYAVSQDLCGPCNDPVEGGQALGVGCSDPYSASLNVVQTNMSPNSTVNAHTGYFPYPWSGWSNPAPTSGLDRRLLIRHGDLEPLFNEGARYFVQGHYVNPDDALAGTHNNNASYREVLVIKTPQGFYEMLTDGAFATQRGRPAVRAWRDVDPGVEETDVQIPGEGLFILAVKAFSPTAGVWRYSYALQNLNSDRSAGRFSVPVSPTSVIANVGFRDVEYHSGEVYDGTDWAPSISADALTWSTTPYQVNPNANAIRFGTSYAFWFDTDLPPTPTTVTIGLFKPGMPSQVYARSVGPQLPLIDCNGNGIVDACDIDCGASGCEIPCGGSLDCNANGMPDECEPDCIGNGIPDDCNIATCPPGELWCADCNENGVPDGCEPDCDGDGIPDDCDVMEDTDGDGVPDCFDRCPLVPIDVQCQCPALGLCCWFDGTICFPDYPLHNCLDDGGTPDCVPAACYQGCLLGDADANGSLDLRDLATLQTCFSGSNTDPGYGAPPQECSIVFDFNEDDDIDLLDYRDMMNQFTGPK